MSMVCAVGVIQTRQEEPSDVCVCVERSCNLPICSKEVCAIDNPQPVVWTTAKLITLTSLLVYVCIHADVCRYLWKLHLKSRLCTNHQSYITGPCPYFDLAYSASSEPCRCCRASTFVAVGTTLYRH